MERVLRELRHPDGKRRVLIIQRENGFFGYEEETLEYVYDGEMRMLCRDMYWVRPSQNPFSICDTPEAAEREARGRILWLADTDSSSQGF